MPRDTAALPVVAKPTAHTLRCFSARRAELFSALNRMSLLRKHGPNPRSYELRAENVGIVKAANQVAAKVLP